MIKVDSKYKQLKVCGAIKGLFIYARAD